MPPANLLHLTLSMGAGGIENLILTMARHLDQKQFNLTVGCLDSGGILLKEVSAMGIDTFVLSRNDGLDVPLIIQLADILRKRRVHILNTHNQAAHFYGCLAGILARTPVVINTEHSRHYIDGHWRRRLEKRALALFTDKIVTVSKELQHKTILKDKIPQSKVEVLENGIDLSLFRTSGIKNNFSNQSKLRDAFGIPQRHKVIGIIGRLHPVKNHALLFKAIQSMVVDHRISISLLVVGDGELRQTLEEMAVTLGIKENVHFAGFRQDIPDILSILDVLVLCSHTEGLPLTLLEAMAAGVPIVVTDTANKSELVQHDVNGLVADPTVASLSRMLARIFKDEVSEGLTRRAKKLAFSEFDITTTIERYQRLYTQILIKKK